MGTLKYADAQSIYFEDRELAHIQLLMQRKLSKHETFLFSYTILPEDGSGRCSFWIASGVPLAFTYQSRKRQRLSRAWLEAMTAMSYGINGILFFSEEELPARLQELTERQQQLLAEQHVT